MGYVIVLQTALETAARVGCDCLRGLLDLLRLGWRHWME